MTKSRWFVLGGLVVCLLLAGVVSNFASGSPDGLDSATLSGCTVNADGEITGGNCAAKTAGEHEVGGPLADYGVAGISNPFLSTGIAGAIGVLVLFAVTFGLFWAVRRRPKAAGEAAEESATDSAADNASNSGSRRWPA